MGSHLPQTIVRLCAKKLLTFAEGTIAIKFPNFSAAKNLEGWDHYYSHSEALVVYVKYEVFQGECVQKGLCNLFFMCKFVWTVTVPQMQMQTEPLMYPGD